MNHRLKFEFEVSNCTPWMMKDASGEKPGRLNGKALRGLMRFWFRALYYGAAQPIPIQGNLLKLRVVESLLFGDTLTKGVLDVIVRDYRESKTLFGFDDYQALEPDNTKKNGQLVQKIDPKDGKPKYKSGRNSLYTAYHMAHEKLQDFTEKHLKQSYSYKIALIINANIGALIAARLSKLKDRNEMKSEFEFLRGLDLKPDQIQEMILNSFQALIWFGGAGGRARKGMGSLQIDKVPQTLRNMHHKDLDYTAFKNEADRLLNISRGLALEPEITAVSKSAQIVYKEKSTALEALRHFDNVYKTFRYRKSGMRKDGKLEEVPTRRTPAPQYAMALMKNPNEAVSAYLKKSYFGLPIEIPAVNASGKIPPVEQGSITCKIKGGDKDTRRASPVFVSVVPIKGPANKCFVATFLHLPARFLPDKSVIKFCYGQKQVDLPVELIVKHGKSYASRLMEDLKQDPKPQGHFHNQNNKFGGRR